MMTLCEQAYQASDSWKYDIMPEIVDGRNVAYFVDPDIEAQLAQLEKEEDALAAAAALEVAHHIAHSIGIPPTLSLDISDCCFSMLPAEASISSHSQQHSHQHEHTQLMFAHM